MCVKTFSIGRFTYSVDVSRRNNSKKWSEVCLYQVPVYRRLRAYAQIRHDRRPFRIDPRDQPHGRFASVGPVLHLDRVAWSSLAFFLGVGLAAHALDEFHDRPLRSNISDVRLLSIAAISLAGALLIGVYASLTVSLWGAPFVLCGGFIVLAYNLEWFLSA